MPRNPRSPPYRSKYALSKSKKTEKFIVTIPKPVVHSSWDTWKIRKTKDGTIIWGPCDFEEINQHLRAKWIRLFEREYQKLKQHDLIGLFIVLDIDEDIRSLKSWKIVSKKLKGNATNSWMWSFQRDVPEYLIDVLYYGRKLVNELETRFKDKNDSEVEAEIPPTYWNDQDIRITKVINDAIVALIGNN